MRARIAAHTQWSREEDPTARTAGARKAFMDRFEREARELHPTGSPEMIARAAESLRKAYFSRLALASAKARSRTKAANEAWRTEHARKADKVRRELASTKAAGSAA
jgi:hypothetical protein